MSDLSTGKNFAQTSLLKRVLADYIHLHPQIPEFKGGRKEGRKEERKWAAAQ